MKNVIPVLLALLIAACGGGGGDGGGGGGNNGGGGSPPPDTNAPVNVNEPVDNNGTYVTFAPSIEIRGSAYVAPDDLDCAVEQPIQLSVEWRNAATGKTGPGGISTRCETSFLGTFAVTRWGVLYGDIELAPGANEITITVSGGGRSGRATITVNRIEDTTPPSITSRNPAPDATNFPVNSKLVVTFSEAMSGLRVERFRVEDPSGTAIDGLLGYNDSNFQWTFSPTSALAYSMTYTVTIDGNVEDRYGGNTLGADVTWSFTTAANPDVTSPTVTGVSPAPNLSCVSPESSVIARFSEAIDAATVNDQTFTLAGTGGNPVDATVLHDGNTAELQPLLALVPDTDYRATLSADIADLAGNTLGADYTWSFRTTNVAGSGTWGATTTNGAPVARYKHTALWTGTEMIVWGGRAFVSGAFMTVNTGGRYDPATDTWRSMSTDGSPAKQDHTAVWTGSEMIVWGDNSDTGGRYDPGTDSWQATSRDGAPSGRTGNVAAWTGSEMIVWGGMSPGGAMLGSGARYNPATDTWTPMSTDAVPSARKGAVHVWTGSELIVWGGSDQQFLDASLTDGARYNPATDSWSPMAATDFPTFSRVVAAWTGTEMILWDGGAPASGDGSGIPEASSTVRLYNPATDTWREPAGLCEPYMGGASLHAHWTGDRMFVWADNDRGGFFYDPATDDWQPVTATGGPELRFEDASVWAGDRFIAWGGDTIYSGFQDTGAVYTP